MIDIIIPAYNAHDTIEDTLHSIAMQVDKDKIHVIIVNDGGKDYNNIVQRFKQWIDIKEVDCPNNCGPGYARNYGIENSNSEYIIFMDADDAFTSSYSLSSLYTIAINSKANIITSKILEIQKLSNNEYRANEMEPNLMWLFGNVYKRSFLEKYNIHFFTTCYNEDVGFNSACSILSYCEKDSVGIATLINSPATYEWKWNGNSLSRKHNQKQLQKAQLNVLGYIYTHLKALYHVEQYMETPPQQYIHGIMIMLFTLYQYHDLMMVQEEDNLTNEFELAQLMELLSRYFCYKYYDFIGKTVSFETFQDELIKHISEDKDRIVISFPDFIDWMFSQPPIEDYNILDIESKLFQSK